MDNVIFEETPPPPPPGGGRAPASRYASTSLFAGVVALVASVAVIGGFIGIGAIVLGARGLRQIRAARGDLRGKPMALAGILLGILAILASLLALGLYLLLPLLLRARYEQEIVGTENHMRTILVACQAYAADDNDFLPPSLAPVVTIDSLNTAALRDIRTGLPPMTQPAGIDLDYAKYEAEIADHSDFIYTGAGLRLTMQGPQRVMILFAKRLALHDRLVGFADGHVERVPPNEWPRIIDAANEALAARKRPPLPPTLLQPPP